MFRGAFAAAVAACLLVAPGAHAAGHAITLSDAQETPCTGAPCTPDLRSVAVYYDSDGTFFVSATFYDALTAYSAAGALRVRVSIGRGLTADGAACTPSGGAAVLSGDDGDVRIEVGAYDGGSSSSTAANGALYRVGSPGSLATTRSVSIDRKTVTVTATNPALTGLDLHCTQAELADDTDMGGLVRDAIAYGWFPGLEPPPPGTAPEDPGTPPGTEPGGGGAAPGTTARPRPALLAAPGVRGVRKVAARLTCGTGRWKHAERFTFTWLRDGRRIARASTRTYRVRPADRTHVIRCRVTAGNAEGTRMSRSRALRIR